MEYFRSLLAELEQGKIFPIYLFYGPETYLQREAVRRFRESLVGTDLFNYEVLDGEEVPPHAVAAVANTLPLSGSRRLLVVKNAPYFASGCKENPALLAYLRAPNAATCLIFCTAEGVDKRLEAFKLIAKHGKAVEFTYLAPEDLKKWFYKKARQAGKILDPAAADALLAAGRDLTVLSSELEKVLAYTQDKPVVTLADVKAVIVPTSEETVFAAIDAFGQRRYLEALRKIRVLLEREPQGVIFSLLTRQLRLLLLVQELPGASSEDLARELGLHPFVAKKILAQARRFPRAELEALFWALLDLDAATKSGREEFLAGLEQRLLLLAKGRSA